MLFPDGGGGGGVIDKKTKYVCSNLTNTVIIVLEYFARNYTYNWMKNKNFQILEIGSFRSFSVKFILETVNDRGNPSTYNPFNKNTPKLDEK